jgi:hypothetical protein
MRKTPLVRNVSKPFGQRYEGETMKRLLLLAYLIGTASMGAQTLTLRGEIRATEGQIRIPYAVVRVAGTELDCVSNANSAQ